MILEALRKILRDIRHFSRVIGRPLRSYQLAPARAIVDSVLNRRGLQFVVMMSRQAGKNELSAQLEAFLLNLYQRKGGFIVKAAPTYKPQVVNSIMRLQEALANPLDKKWRMEHGYMVTLGRARVAFFSAQPQASVVGATANILLECDEAQDVDEEKWNKDFRPMAASANTTTVYYGTAWTSRTLLAKQTRLLKRLEAEDGIKRVFAVPWETVAQENPAYGDYVRGEIQRLGRSHPLVKTQYFLEEIDAEGGMFPDSRIAQMQGSHPRQRSPLSLQPSALLIDLAGEDEDPDLQRATGRRDSTALTVVEVDRSTCADPLIRAPTYHVLDRRLWTGVRHTTLYATLLDLANVWGASQVVVDATGVGAGLASFLAKALGDRLVPFVFTSQSKSELGWSFLAICDTGRFKDYAPDGQEDTTTFWRQVRAADYEILDGPGKRMKWGVADPLTHDDLLISAALCAVLDAQDFTPYAGSFIVAPEEVNNEHF